MQPDVNTSKQQTLIPVCLGQPAVVLEDKEHDSPWPRGTWGLERLSDKDIGDAKVAHGLTSTLSFAHALPLLREPPPI
jgi:hypothetical protein